MDPTFRERLINTPFLFLSIVGAIVLIIAAVLFDLPQAAAWPATEGIVMASEVAEKWFGSDTSWCPSVSYAYEVDDIEYTSDQLTTWVSMCNGTTNYIALQTVQQHPVGSRVRVHYDPRHPTSAVLEPGFPDDLVVPAIIASAAVGVGLSLFIVGLLGLLGIVGFPAGPRSPRYRTRAG